MALTVYIAVLCDKQGCHERFEAHSSSETMAHSSSETMALCEARDEGWKVDLKSQAARCPEHAGSGGASLLALGAGAL